MLSAASQEAARSAGGGQRAAANARAGKTNHSPRIGRKEEKTAERRGKNGLNLLSFIIGASRLGWEQKR